MEYFAGGICILYVEVMPNRDKDLSPEELQKKYLDPYPSVSKID